MHFDLRPEMNVANNSEDLCIDGLDLACMQANLTVRRDPCRLCASFAWLCALIARAMRSDLAILRQSSAMRSNREGRAICNDVAAVADALAALRVQGQGHMRQVPGTGLCGLFLDANWNKPGGLPTDVAVSRSVRVD